MSNTSKKEKKDTISKDEKISKEIKITAERLSELLQKHAEYKGKQNDKMARSIRRQLRTGGYYISKQAVKKEKKEDKE